MDRKSHRCHLHSHNTCSDKNRKCTCECHKSKIKDRVTKIDKIQYLLKRQPVNMGMMISYTGGTHGSTKQHLTLLRRRGVKISFSKKSGYYTMHGVKNEF